MNENSYFVCSSFCISVTFFLVFSKEPEEHIWVVLLRPKGCPAPHWPFILSRGETGKEWRSPVDRMLQNKNCSWSLTFTLRPTESLYCWLDLIPRWSLLASKRLLASSRCQTWTTMGFSMIMSSTSSRWVFNSVTLTPTAAQHKFITALTSSLALFHSGDEFK